MNCLFFTEAFSRADFHFLVVGIDCQLDRIRNHPGDKLLGLSVGEFLDWANGGKKTHPKCGRNQLWAWTEFKEEEGEGGGEGRRRRELKISFSFSALSFFFCNDFIIFFYPD